MFSGKIGPVAEQFCDRSKIRVHEFDSGTRLYISFQIDFPAVSGFMVETADVLPNCE